MTAARCSLCGESVWWVMTIGGFVSLDPYPAADGSFIVTRRHGEDVARDFDPSEHAKETRYQAHKLTCRQKELF